MKTIRIRTLSCLVALSGIAAPAFGQTEADVEKWIRSTVERAKSFELPETIEVRKETIRFPLSEAQIAEWRNTVRDAPSHPLRVQIEHQERMLKNGPDRDEVQVMFADSKLWRISTTCPTRPDMPYSDAAMDGSVFWSIDDKAIALTDRTPVLGEPDFAAQSLGNEMTSLRFLISQGMYFAFSDAKTEFAVTTTGSQWTATGKNKTGATFTISGSVSAEKPSIRAARIATDNGPGQQFTVEVGSIVTDPYLGDIATSLDVKMPNAHYLSRLVSVVSVSRDDVKRVAAAPDPAQIGTANGLTDPVRGKLNLTRVKDLRRDQRTEAIQSDQGWATSQLPSSESAPGYWRYSAIGWIALSCIAALLVWIRLRARAKAPG